MINSLNNKLYPNWVTGLWIVKVVLWLILLLDVKLIK